MPTYGYECTACKDEFEIFQSIKDAVLTTCEKCGGSLRKRIYPVGIAFKGPGFYVNDYAKSSAGGSSAAKPAETTTPAETAAPDKPAAGSESKTAEASAPAAPAAASAAASAAA